MPPGPSPLHPLLCAPFLVSIPQQPNFVLQNIAAQQNHRDACFALTAWYLVGSPGVLPQSDTEAYLWAKRAAEAELVKAMYAVGYFLEVGIGTSADMKECVNVFILTGAMVTDSRYHCSTERYLGTNARPRKEISARPNDLKRTRIPRSFSLVDPDLCCEGVQMARVRTGRAAETRTALSCKVWIHGRITRRFHSWPPVSFGFAPNYSPFHRCYNRELKPTISTSFPILTTSLRRLRTSFLFYSCNPGLLPTPHTYSYLQRRRALELRVCIPCRPHFLHFLH